MGELPEASVDAIVTDPPYGLEFMGKSWDAFRIDDTGTDRWRGDAAGAKGGVRDENKTNPAAGRVSLGGGNRPTTSRCVGCGKRDQFRNRHEPCGEGPWRTELIDPHAAPPSMLAFQEWSRVWAIEAKRVLRPGGHLLAFGGTRTYHRMAAAIEDAGFEIRDCLMWIYGSGFPKSLDVGKAIDKHLGAEREVIGKKTAGIATPGIEGADDHYTVGGIGVVEVDVTAPGSPEAERWDGWGTALKPSHEPIVVARKPLTGSVAANVLDHGTGGLNIDGCRIDTGDEVLTTPYANPENRRGVVGTEHYWGKLDAEEFHRRQEAAIERANSLGRWPANIILQHLDACEPKGKKRVKSSPPPSPSDNRKIETFAMGENYEPKGYGDENGTEAVEAYDCAPGCPIAELDRQSGELTSRPFKAANTAPPRDVYQDSLGDYSGTGYTDTGGASRFFYTPKVSRAERNAGVGGEPKAVHRYGPGIGEGLEPEAPAIERNIHPTVKPIELMRWLIRLVTPPGGTVLDPFLGSGSTGCAAAMEGFSFIGCEREDEYAEIAEARIAWWSKLPAGTSIPDAMATANAEAQKRDAGQDALF